MALECIDPPGLPVPPQYSHVVVATGSRLVFVAGQVAEDGEGAIIGPGDIAVQARQAFANLGHALAAAGARPDQVTKIGIFVARYRREYLPAIEAGRVALFGAHKPADTLVGVEALSRSGYLIEVDAIAVVLPGEPPRGVRAWPLAWPLPSGPDVVQAAAAAQQKETITMTGEPSIVRWLDEILPLAMKPTPSGARLDLRLYFTENKKGRWLSVEVHDADGRQVGKSLPIDKQEHIGQYFDDLAAKAYPVAATKRTKPLQR